MILTYLLEQFDVFLLTMTLLAVVVFVALYFINAGYGITFDKKWGFAINNKIAWFCMEMPVFLLMTVLCLSSARFSQFHLSTSLTPFIFFVFFQIHYARRAFIYPFLLRGKSQMPVTVMLMGIVFNVCNAFMQGGWIFHKSPETMYPVSWLLTPQFIIGSMLFFGGMLLNIRSDKIIRSLRKEGDSKHYLPYQGLFKKVTCAHYLGEIVEWTGFALLTWSVSGAVFALWTFANLTPRANAVYKTYKSIFGEEKINSLKLKRLFPYIY